MRRFWRTVAIILTVLLLYLPSTQPRLVAAATQEINGLTFDVLRYDLDGAVLELRIQHDLDYTVNTPLLVRSLKTCLKEGRYRYYRLVWLWVEDQWSATAGAANYNKVAIIVGKAGLDLSQIPPPRDRAFWEADRHNLPVHLNKVAWHELDHAIKFYTGIDPSKDIKYEVTADNFAKENWKKLLIIRR
jgi:hypothetical protein